MHTTQQRRFLAPPISNRKRVLRPLASRSHRPPIPSERLSAILRRSPRASRRLPPRRRKQPRMWRKRQARRHEPSCLRSRRRHEISTAPPGRSWLSKPAARRSGRPRTPANCPAVWPRSLKVGPRMRRVARLRQGRRGADPPVCRTVGGRGPEGLVDDVTRFARRRPLVFIGACAGAGFLLTRFVRAGAVSGSNSPNGAGDHAHEQGGQGGVLRGPRRWAAMEASVRRRPASDRSRARVMEAGNRSMSSPAVGEPLRPRRALASCSPR